MADVSSLRGEASIDAEPQPPKLERYINDKEPIKRNFAQQPPLIPHTVDRYTISRDENKCLDCHVKQPGKDESKAVEIGASHFVDREGHKLSQMAGNRQFCLLCHVPQIDAEPLVESSFTSVLVK